MRPTNKKGMTINLDCDGVLIDFNGYVTMQARGRGFDVYPADCKEDTRKYDWWHKSGLEEEWKQPGFCEKLPLIEGAQEFVENLRKKDLQVLFVTSPPKENPTWPFERKNVLEKHFGAKREDVIFAVDKRYVHGRVFVDDHAKNIVSWQEYWEKETGVLVKRPWNEKFINEECYQFEKDQDWKHKGTDKWIHLTNDFEDIENFIERAVGGYLD